MEHFDIAIVGLGALGSATAYQLTRQTKGRAPSVIAFEQFALGHVRGASHDTSRIIRRTYHAADYVRLADSAYRDWADLEASTGERLVTTTGGLTFYEPGAPMRAEDYASSLTACDVPFELLGADEVRQRWPQFRLAPDVTALYQDDTGIVPASRTTAVLQILARAQGATLRAECAVTALEPLTDGVLLETASGAVHADTVVVCADAWTNKLLAPFGAGLPLASTLEQVTYFQPSRPELFAPGALPVWIWEGEPCFYGFPTYGEPTVKAARDSSGVPLEVDHRSFEPVPERLAELEGFMRGFLPGSGEPLRTVTCQYTLTPDRDFALGPLPDHPDILVAIGCGHAFKFTPTIGRILAELATAGACADDIAMFRLDRPMLTTGVGERATPSYAFGVGAS